MYTFFRFCLLRFYYTILLISHNLWHRLQVKTIFLLGGFLFASLKQWKYSSIVTSAIEPSSHHREKQHVFTNYYSFVIWRKHFIKVRTKNLKAISEHHSVTDFWKSFWIYCMYLHCVFIFSDFIALNWKLMC